MEVPSCFGRKSLVLFTVWGWVCQ